MTYAEIITAINKAKRERSYRDLGTASGVNHAVIYKALNSQHVINGASLVKLCEAVGLQIELKKVI